MNSVLWQVQSHRAPPLGFLRPGKEILKEAAQLFEGSV